MTIEEIRELLVLFNESGVAELEVQRGENRVRLRRASLNHEYMVAAPSTTIMAAPPAAYVGPSSSYSGGFGGATAAATGTAHAQALDPSSEKHDLVKSPIVGTFYDAASPGSAPFVKVGDLVEKGQVLCVIESMKLMNEIEAEVPGTVMAKLVENGKPVEYGQSLFAIKLRS